MATSEPPSSRPAPERQASGSGEAPEQPRFAGYLLAQRVGLGGSAEVFRATAPDGQPVALKRALPHEREDPRAVDRWRYAASLQREVGGRGVLDVLEEGVAPATGSLGPWPWLVTRWVGQTTLERWRPEPEDRRAAAAQLVADLVVALCRLRAAGVVHRDLVAGHVLIEHGQASGAPVRAWLVDFGAAARIHEPDLAPQIVPRRSLVPPWLRDATHPAPAPIDPAWDAWAFARLVSGAFGDVLDGEAHAALDALADPAADHDAALARLGRDVA